MIFSKRLKLSREADIWMRANGVKQDTFGAVCALDALGYLGDTPKQAEPIRHIEEGKVSKGGVNRGDPGPRPTAPVVGQGGSDV